MTKQIENKKVLAFHRALKGAVFVKHPDMKVRFCPNCESEEIMLATGGITGGFVCKDCGFSGAIFPEKEIPNKSNKLRERKK